MTHYDGREGGGKEGSVEERVERERSCLHPTNRCVAKYFQKHTSLSSSVVFCSLLCLSFLSSSPISSPLVFFFGLHLFYPILLLPNSSSLSFILPYHTPSTLIIRLFPLIFLKGSYTKRLFEDPDLLQKKLLEEVGFIIILVLHSSSFSFSSTFVIIIILILILS